MKLNFARRTEWYRWFAWYPVLIGTRKYAWLEMVERRYDTAEWYRVCHRIPGDQGVGFITLSGSCGD